MAIENSECAPSDDPRKELGTPAVAPVPQNPRIDTMTGNGRGLARVRVEPKDDTPIEYWYFCGDGSAMR